MAGIDEEKQKILSVLEAEQKCLSIIMIARRTGINRHTVARHLDVLEILGKVRKIEIGCAKKYLLVRTLPVSGLIDISTDLILILDSSLTIQYINSAAARRCNTSLHALLGRRIDEAALPLFSDPRIISAVSEFSYEKGESKILQDTDGRWMEVTILGFSLLQAPNQIAVICIDISEKIQSEKEFNRIQEKYLLAFHASPDGIIITDFETGEILEVNSSFCTITGYSWEELIGNTFFKIGIFPTINWRNLLIEETTMQKTGSCSFDIQFNRRSGESCNVGISSRVTRIGNQDCLLTVVRDITERKKIEEKLRKSEEMYRLLAEYTQDVIWVMDCISFRFTFISPSVERLLGFSPAEFLSRPLPVVMTEDSYRRVMENYSGYLNDVRYRRVSLYHRFRMDLLRSDGSLVPTEARITYIENSAGSPSQVIGVSRDISSQLLIEERLRQSERQYRLLAESIRDVFWLIDPETEILQYVSPASCFLRGYQPEEIIGRPVSDILEQNQYLVFHEDIQRRIAAFKDGDDSARHGRIEVIQYHRDGYPIWIELSSSFVAGDDRKVTHIIGISRNLSGYPVEKIR